MIFSFKISFEFKVAKGNRD